MNFEPTLHLDVWALGYRYANRNPEKWYDAQNLRMRHQPASFDRSALRTSVPGTVSGVIASLMLIRVLFLSI